MIEQWNISKKKQKSLNNFSLVLVNGMVLLGWESGIRGKS